MNTGDLMKQLTVDKETVNKFYDEEMKSAQFKIKSSDIFIDDVIRYYNTEIHAGKSLGWIKTEDKFRIRPSELTVLTGVSGHGKSMWLSQVVLHLMKTTRCLVSSLEMRPVLTLSRMITQALGGGIPTDDYIRKFCERAQDRLYIYDQTGVTTSDDMIATLHWGKHVLGVEVFVIDSLMKMADIAEDKYDAQKMFIDRLATACRDLNIHVFLVAHTRKMADEDDVPDATHILGSSHIRNLCDNIICVWRNRNKEKMIDQQNKDIEDIKNLPDAKVFIQKNRNGQFEGGFNFWFNPESMKYLEHTR